MAGPSNASPQKSPRTDAQLLSAAIAATGALGKRPLSVRMFAKFIVRNPRNVYRWLKEPEKGGTPLPQAVRDRCGSILAETPEKLRTEVDTWLLSEFHNGKRKKVG